MALLTAKTRYGDVSGVRCGHVGYSVFKGVPYAAPPVGELRWKAPANPAPWDGTKVCDKFSSIAVQNKARPGEFYTKEFFPIQEPMSEDCLYLNIWTPAEDTTAALPVMVWIHGGAYLQGYGHEMEFDGEAFCKRGVILVTINYRLGPMGYFAHPELTAASENGASGNYGVLDQIHALKWVRENIEAFGGNADNITVFGQSAGGGSVLSICASPLAKGLFHKAIIQSAAGVGTLGGEYTLADAEKYGAFIVENAGLSFSDFRNLPAEEILEKSMVAMMAYGGGFALRLRPCTDGYVLPQDPGTVIGNKEHAPVPYMAGVVSGDSKLFGEQEIDWLRIKHGDNPLYVYYFDHEVPGDDNAGAFHSSELWYIFGTLQRCWRPMSGRDYDLSQAMTDYWTNFAKAGNPGNPAWASHSSDNPYIHELRG